MGTTPTSLAAYIGVLRRRFALVLLATILVPAAAIAVSLNQQKLYRASVQVLISGQTPQDLVGTSTSAPSVDPTRRANTEIAVAETPTVARRTLAALGVHDRTAAELLARTSITAASDADILTIAVTDPDPTLAVHLADQYATEFIGYEKQLDTASVRAALEGVDARIKILKKETSRGAGTDPARADELRILLSRQQTLETQANLQGGKLFVIRQASSAGQVQPRLVRNALAGVGVGFVLGLALAFLVHALDTRVRTGADAAAILGLPLLGRLPTPPRRLRRRGVAMLDRGPANHVEAYQNLRTSLDLANLKTRAKTILVTSAVASEGKSTTAANLAVALARAGRRVALVDLDLRDPCIAGLFKIDGQPGVTGIATGAVAIRDALVSVSIRPGGNPRRSVGTDGTPREQLGAGGALDVLPSGVTPADPAAFLTTSELEELIRHLRNTYDVVLIDSPPALPVGDAMTLTGKVDAVIVMVRAGVVRWPSIVELRRLLDAAPCEKLGFVLTGAESASNYGYGSGSYGAIGQAEIQAAPSSTRS